MKTDKASLPASAERISDIVNVPDAPKADHTSPHEITIGCWVRWGKKALIDFNPDHWWATNKQAVRVKGIKTHEGTIWQGNRTIIFETPIEKTFGGDTTAAFEFWIEHCCENH